MAVHRPLTSRALRHHLRAYRVGELLAARALATGHGQSVYEVSTSQGRFLLRILEQRSLADARFEAALLAHLASRGLPVPQMLDAGRRGRGGELPARQHLALFAYLPGREIGVFEATAEHARQLGYFLARLHQAARGLGRRRRNPCDPEHTAHLGEACQSVASGSPLARDVSQLICELGRHRWARELPRGIVHGAARIDRARFKGGSLVGVLDFEAACVAPLLYDVAAALSDWAFAHDAFVPARAGALVAGYEEIRPLRPLEKGALYEFVRYCCARQALAWLHAYELRPARRGQARVYRDYRHFLRRLAALQATGATEFWAQVGRVRVGRDRPLPAPA